MYASEDLSNEYTRAIAGANLQELFVDMLALQIKDEASSRIIHWTVPDAGYAEPCAVFASEQVQRDILHKLLQQQRTVAESSLAAIMGSREQASWAGFVFEAAFHVRVKAGDDFPCRSLEEDEKGEEEQRAFNVSSRRPLIFKDRSEVCSVADHTYCIPASSTFKAVDSMLPPGALFQVRVGLILS